MSLAQRLCINLVDCSPGVSCNRHRMRHSRATARAASPLESAHRRESTDTVFGATVCGEATEKIAKSFDTMRYFFENRMVLKSAHLGSFWPPPYKDWFEHSALIWAHRNRPGIRAPAVSLNYHVSRRSRFNVQYHAQSIYSTGPVINALVLWSVSASLSALNFRTSPTSEYSRLGSCCVYRCPFCVGKYDRNRTEKPNRVLRFCKTKQKVGQNGRVLRHSKQWTLRNTCIRKAVFFSVY